MTRIDPDLIDFFKTPEVINEALRDFMRREILVREIIAAGEATSEEEYDLVVWRMNLQLKKGFDNLTPDEDAFLESLTMIVEKYDDIHYNFDKESGPAAEGEAG